MDFDISAFRIAFPEFGDTEKYPTSQIQFWAGLASQLVRPCIWKTCWQQGMSLYVAHEITISSRNSLAASFGGTPGTFGGVSSSKTVGGATAAYDSTSTSEKDAGWWNLTTYGKQFIRLARIFGAGAIQL